MEHLQGNLQRVGRAFLQTALLPQQPKVLTVFLGGSQLYAASKEPSRYNVIEEQSSLTDTFPDWDGAIVVDTKHDIFTLVNEHRSILMGMLAIEQEECPGHEFRVPAPHSPTWSDFDAVRFAGYDKLGAKRSVKVLSMEYFSQSRTSLNILSSKDRRVYEAVRSGSTSYRIQQATTITDQFLILHDQWVYAAHDHLQNLSCVAFGVTADMLVSGACLIGRYPYGLEIKRKILAHYLLIAGEHSTFRSFAKSAHFSHPYISWLSQELSGLQCPQYARLVDRPTTDRSFPPRNWPLLLFCSTTTIRSAASHGILGRARILPLDAYQEFERGSISQPLPEKSSDFTSNSKTFHVRTKGNTEIFCKESKHAQDEMQGASLASAFYPRIAVPHISASGVLLYPFFSGTTESDLRLSYIVGGRKNWDAGETLLYAELVKAEDMLRAYRNSMLRDMALKETTSCPKIHRFFHARLVSDARLREFYGAALQLRGESFPFDKFLAMPWIINGKRYPSLRESFDVALKTVSPSSLQSSSCPAAFGLGDAHGGNVMVSPKAQHRRSHTLLYVDYEVAGFHPIMLDLAKPFYNDVFFETLYHDLVAGPMTGGVRYLSTGDTLVVDFAPQVDWISQAVLDIKLRYLIQPLCDEVQKVGNCLNSHVSILANALLLCATLTRNFATEEDAFLRNFATGIILSGSRSWGEFAMCLETLGFSTLNLSLS